MKIVTVVGARPQFIKAAVLSPLLRTTHTEILVHTGQHYDENLSAAFFRELGLAVPDYHLGVGSGTHGRQTGAMLTGVEEVLTAELPDCVLVYGDTNSTLAGALAAGKLGLPVAHVEAGLRSYNRQMPEEINRVLTDHLATLLLCPTARAVENLAREGIVAGVYQVGDVMYDAALRYATLGDRALLRRLGVKPQGYVLATVHRAENVDDSARLARLAAALNRLDETIVFPVHPRTRRALRGISFVPARQVQMIEPVGYADMLKLEQAARLILTDSGGVQKEAYMLGVPCLTLRDESEWMETVAAGWNRLVGVEPERILDAVRAFPTPSSRPSLFGDGQAGSRILAVLERQGWGTAGAVPRGH
jgi:UDP-GlcNAc3NAcA epimerase